MPLRLWKALDKPIKVRESLHSQRPGGGIEWRRDCQRIGNGTGFRLSGMQPFQHRHRLVVIRADLPTPFWQRLPGQMPRAHQPWTAGGAFHPDFTTEVRPCKAALTARIAETPLSWVGFSIAGMLGRSTIVREHFSLSK